MLSQSRIRLIQRKLLNMDKYISQLQLQLQTSQKRYLSDYTRQRAMERLCQVIIEFAIDTSMLIVTGLKMAPPESAREGFQKIYQLNVIDTKLLQSFERYVGFRNRIVHEYEALDQKIIYRTARNLVDDSRAFISSIQNFIST